MYHQLHPVQICVDDLDLFHVSWPTPLLRGSAHLLGLIVAVSTLNVIKEKLIVGAVL